MLPAGIPVWEKISFFVEIEFYLTRKIGYNTISLIDKKISGQTKKAGIKAYESWLAIINLARRLRCPIGFW
jgi:hypothetical protein